MLIFRVYLQQMTKFDSINTKILRELQYDGRISNSDLANKVALSPSACLRRVQELEKSGVITGYRAVLSPAALGVGFVAYVTVGLSRHTKKELDAFELAIANAAEVTECHNITGAVEYLLRVEVENLLAYKRFHSEVLGSLPQVSTLMSYIVMESPKDLRS